jgi:hypothetical protein
MGWFSKLTDMRTIRDFLSESCESGGLERAEKGDEGTFSEWLPFCEIELKGNALQFVETRVLGLRGEDEFECVEIPAEPGGFTVECRGARFGGDSRIAGMRAFPKGVEVERGVKLKDLPVDLGGVSVVDIGWFVHACDSPRYETWLDRILYGEDGSLVKLHQWDDILIPSVESGFGDGTYEVFSLVSDGVPLGLEIIFIQQGEVYPIETD